MTRPSPIGQVHSFQSLGTLDGPGVRFVAFLQGCNLRCGCCHNPDTWEDKGGKSFTAQEVLDRALRYREYFAKDGGITLSGGEPLLQPLFAKELFSLCHEHGIHTCLDTSGSILSDEVLALLEVTDRVLLDIKYTNDEDYRTHVGCSMEKPLAFLSYLCEAGIPTTLRQVIIPTLNDNEESVLKLKALADAHPNVDQIELLPFRKICQVKYDKINLPFRFEHLPEPTREVMQRLEALIR